MSVSYRVAIWKGEARYPTLSPFHPAVPYPEYRGTELSQEKNPAYEGVRESFRLLGMDAGRFNTPEWNPLGEIVHPGDRVLIKPNFVLSHHADGGYLFSIVTHPSVIRAVLDYVVLALKGEGSVVISDAPQMDCDFSTLSEQMGLSILQDWFWHVYKMPLEIVDLRSFWQKEMQDGVAYSHLRMPLPGDPLGEQWVNLGKRSAFYGVADSSRFYGADYDRNEVIRHHHGEVQEYALSRTVLSADVVISIPKLKVHKKVGVTLNAKGLVGICTNKNTLVHYQVGFPEQGGDQFPPDFLSPMEKLSIRAQRWLFDHLLARQNPLFNRVYGMLRSAYWKTLRPVMTGESEAKKRIFDGGNWYGNDSAWRMTADLAQMFYHVDAHGNWCDLPPRRMFSIVDGIIGGDREGPLTPRARHSGVLIAGEDLLAVDWVATRLMGFNPQRLRWIEWLQTHGFADHFSEISLITEVPEWLDLLSKPGRYLEFEPHPGWKNYLELDDSGT